MTNVGDTFVPWVMRPGAATGQFCDLGKALNPFLCLGFLLPNRANCTAYVIGFCED